MNWSRDKARTTSRCLRVVLLLVSLRSVPGCVYARASLGNASARRARAPRAALALLVPKLDLRWQLVQTGAAPGAGSGTGSSAHVHTGIAAWLRWQPTLYAAQVPTRYELSPAAWAAPCELDDVTCFTELAESEREIGDALQPAR